MEVETRVLVSTLLSLVSLSVLSFHIALCLHYPSPLFAVTLLLNPSLWLFIGLMCVFCSSVIRYRDKRKKQTSAYSPLDQDKSISKRPQRQHCCCRNRNSHLNYNQTAAYFSPKTHGREKLKIITRIEPYNPHCQQCQNEFLISSNRQTPSDKIAAKEGTQNFSCLVKTSSRTGTSCQNALVTVKPLQTDQTSQRKSEVCPRMDLYSYVGKSSMVHTSNGIRSKLLRSNSFPLISCAGVSNSAIPKGENPQFKAMTAALNTNNECTCAIWNHTVPPYVHVNTNRRQGVNITAVQVDTCSDDLKDFNNDSFLPDASRGKPAESKLDEEGCESQENKVMLEAYKLHTESDNVNMQGDSIIDSDNYSINSTSFLL